jgi:pimeloyl-ACP methyl ester carboxylesterase
VQLTSVTVGGIRSPVLTSGPQDGEEAVVFVHGNPGPAEDFRDLVQGAGEFARAVAPDLPGFGQAEKPRDFPYTVEGFAGHLAGILAELGITRAHLVLHDFGGPFGLNWAVRHPAAFRSATLINTGVLSGYRWHRYGRIWRTPVLGELFQLTASRPAYRLLLGRENPRLTPGQIDRLHQVSRPVGTKRAVLKLYRATPAEAMAGPVAPLRELDRPALVLWGTDDAYLPVEFAERQREAFPSAEVHRLEGLGHWPFVEDPAQVAGHVIPFLRRQLGAEDPPAAS